MSDDYVVLLDVDVSENDVDLSDVMSTCQIMMSSGQIDFVLSR